MSDECVIPPPLPPEAAAQFLVEPDELGAKHVIEYMAGQASDEEVKHLEKVKTEKIYGTRYDVWDVVTDKDRWWVITSPTNLYSQELFPSLDYTLSFHIGLMMRVAALRASKSKIDEADVFAPAWRKWTQAAEAADQADEPEEYQAVGMRCREALLAFVKAAASPELVPHGQGAPKAGDFKAWAGLLAAKWIPGSGTKQMRSYLKSSADATWQLVNWLTHTTEANRYDAVTAASATEGVLLALATAYGRHSHGLPRRCPVCGSYQITSDYESDAGAYRPHCRTCGWQGELYQAD